MLSFKSHFVHIHGELSKKALKLLLMAEDFFEEKYRLKNA